MSAPTSAPTDEKQSRPHLFQKGQSGNPAGRQKGIRNKLGEDFLKALQADFEEHGIEVIAQVRAEKPDVYMKVIASVLPKEIELTGDVVITTKEQRDAAAAAFERSAIEARPH
jgi:hypothetical protein